LHPVFQPSSEESIAATPPLMPMPTSLRLNASEEDKMVQYALNRYSHISQNYARVEGDDSWHGQRKKAMMQWEGDFSYRLSQPGIYKLSNKSLGTIRRVIRTGTAKVVSDLFGADPFFGLMPEGPEDDVILTKNLERWGHYKAEEGKVRMTGRAAIQGALVRGESVVMRALVNHESRWMGPVEIAHTAEGMPIGDSNRQPIKRDAQLIPHVLLEGAWCLASDPDTVLPKDFRWVAVALPQSETKRTIDLGCVWWEDFFCDLTEADVHKADYNCIRKDVSYNVVASMLRGARRPDYARRILDEIRNNQSRPESAIKQADPHRGEDVPHYETTPTAALTWHYMTLDADADGYAEEIFLIVETQSKRPVFYDYLQNVFKDGRRPYDVTRLNPVEGRWFGTGMYEANRPLNDFVELLFNRINLRCSTAGRLNFSNPNACKETAGGEMLDFGNASKTFTLNDGYTKDDAFSYVVAPALDENATSLLNMCLQAIQLELGQIDAGEGALSGMPSTELATGIKSLERQAAAILKDMLFCLSDGLGDMMRGWLAYQVAYMDEEEAMQVMEGDAWSVLQLQRADVQKLRYKIKLLLTPTRGAEMLQQSEQAINIGLAYHKLVMENPSAASAMRPLFIQKLKALEVQDADSICPPVTLPALQPQDQQTVEPTGADATLSNPENQNQ